MVSQEEQRAVRVRAEERAEDRLVDALLPAPVPISGPADPTSSERTRETREKLRRLLRAGDLDAREVEVELADAPASGSSLSIMGMPGGEDIGSQWKDLLAGMLPRKSKKRRLKVGAAREALIQEEAEALVDADRVRELAVRRVEQSGIVFIDEIDKVAVSGGRQGPDVSREGVQRDLLPIVEGSTVQTKHGPVSTDHILFIAAGAFHSAKPSDLMPELQGRFPIRVELASLGREDLVRILTEPTNSLVRQYTALLATEGVELDFERSGIEAIAEIAATVNERNADIGARRLHTVMERLLEDLSFDAPDLPNQRVTIDAALVHKRLGDLLDDQDLSQFIL
jgi:ATP-dependent HslUV protease ATP-binding subunit HslU